MTFAFTSDENCLHFYFTSLSGVGAARFPNYAENTCLSAIQSFHVENANYLPKNNRFNSVIQCVIPRKALPKRRGDVDSAMTQAAPTRRAAPTRCRRVFKRSLDLNPDRNVIYQLIGN